MKNLLYLQFIYNLGSRDFALVRVLASHYWPKFNSRTQCDKWVEFVVAQAAQANCVFLVLRSLIGMPSIEDLILS